MAERYMKRLAIPLLQGTIRVSHYEVWTARFIMISVLIDDLRGMQVGMTLLGCSNTFQES